MSSTLGDKLSTQDEVAFRNVRSQFIEQDGHISKQVFEPARGDEGLLSMDRASMITAKASFELFLSRGNVTSTGVLGVTIGECTASELSVLSNPLADNQAHCVGDFRAFGNSQSKKCARKLRESAMKRGWLHRAKEAK